MDKLSLKTLREKFEESLQSPPLGDYNTLLGAMPSLLSIAEAARDAEPCIPNPHLDRCNCSACIKRKHLRAALAQVEE